MKIIRILLLVLNVVFVRLFGSDNVEALALLKQPHHYALIRHALAPGTGDPATFDLTDCSTQRNISETGRKQAEAMGTLFREQGIEKAEVLTSQWCRCKETAALFNLGKVSELPALNSFFGRPQNKKSQMEALDIWFANHKHAKPTLLVTHQVVITALTGVFPASGEIIVIRVDSDGEIEVMGRVQTL
jgi:broad specificity phosphatase PhoE